MDYSSGVLDEIALEGLDGITIEGLWLRLSDRRNFIFSSQINDDDTKVFLWNLVRRLRDAQFFCLEEPREPITINSFYTIDPELGTITETNLSPSDLYPHCLIDEGGVIGSCSTYFSREDVTTIVRKLDLKSVIDKFGDRLVIVAKQDVRRKALLGLHLNPHLEISPIQYCILERVGRSRYLGEPTQGKSGLSALGEDAKTIFYLRKYLLKHKLIVKQNFQKKTVNNMSGLLLHLPRFYMFYKPRYLQLIEQILDIMSQLPDNFIEYNVLREKVPGVLKKLSKITEFKKYLDADIQMPFRLVYPNTDPKVLKVKGDKEKMIRVVQLRKPYTDAQQLKKLLLNTCDENDEEESPTTLLDDKRECIDSSLMHQCCEVLKVSGGEGLSQTEIAKALGLPKIRIRTMLRNLIKTGAASTYMIDIGRQRISKYYLMHHRGMNENHNIVFMSGHNPDQSLCNDSFNESNYSINDNTFDDITKENNSTDININTYSYKNLTGIKRVDFKVDYDTTKPLEPLDEVVKPTKRKTSETDNNPTTSVNTKKIKLEIEEANNESTRVSDFSNNNVDDILCEDRSLELTKVCNKMDVDFPVEEKSLTPLMVYIPNEVDSNKLNSIDSTQTNGKVKDNIEVTINNNYSWLIPETCKNQGFKIIDNSLKTLRLLKRSNWVIEAVHKYKVITDIQKLVLMINECEYREGLSSRMDKKSLMRILFKLASDRHIKVYRAMLKQASKVINLNFICNTNIEPDDSIIKSVIEFNKLKFHALSAEPKKVPNLSSPKRLNITFEKRSSFSHHPKCIRMKIIHRLLFYLVYSYAGNESLDQDLARSKVQKECQIDPEEMLSLPQLYLSKIDEKMFIPPLPRYGQQGEQMGWSRLSDILSRMPLSIFASLVQIPYHIPELEGYINHPVKKHILVNDLPVKIRNCITATRKYIFTIHEVMMKLVYIGLLQFGPQHNKEKDQIFVFMNCNATLMDTTLSRPGYIKVSKDIDYPLQRYQFKSLENVDEYWHNCWKICMNTRLGRKSLSTVSDIIEKVYEKVDMVNSLRSREFMEAPALDTGYVPGDKLGAAGFDSSLFAHLKRNWFQKNPTSFEPKKQTQAVKPRPVRPPPTLPINGGNHPLKRKLSESSIPSVQTITKVPKKEKKVTLVPSGTKVIKIRKPKSNIKINRINPVKKSLHRKPFYDQIDKEALNRMSKLRVEWSPEEDRVLLICKVAAAFICPDLRRQVNANLFLACREILHKTLPFSKNKTSRACQRRVAYMLRSTSTCHNVDVCVEELKRDDYIMGKYGDTLDLIKQETKSTGKRIIEMGNFWKERFKGLVGDLMSRYNNYNRLTSFLFIAVNNDPSLLPDNLEEFHQKFYLQCVEKKEFKRKNMFTPVTNVNDIYSAVMNTTIHSTLSCNSDKTSWSYHLFSIYQQYPERILRNMLNKLRDNQMVSFKKSYQARNKHASSYYLPLTASPFQLSITYVNLIQTKYQTTTYYDCYKLFTELLDKTAEDIKTAKNHNEKGFELLSLTGGSTAAIVELFCSGVVSFDIDIPNQIILLDPNVKNKDETYTRLVERYKDVLTSYKTNLTTSVLFQKHNYMSVIGTNNDNFEDEDEIFDKDMNDKDVSNSRAIQNVAKAASRIALYLMNDDNNPQSGLVPKEMEHVYDFFVVNSCRVYTNVIKHSDVLTSNENGITKDCNVISDTNIKDILDSIRDSALFCNVNPVDPLDTLDCSKDDEDDHYKIKEYDDVAIDKIIKSNFENPDFDLVKSMLAKIKTKHEIGLSNIDLIAEFGNSLKTVELIDKLIKLFLVLKAGSVQFRYVHYTFVRPWLLHSYRNLRCDKDSRLPLKNLKCLKVSSCQYNISGDTYSDDENSKVNENIIASDKPSTSTTVNVIDDDRYCMTKENLSKLTTHKMAEPIKVMIRPWIRIDGTLNRRVLDTILSSILSHIMLCPGSSLASVQLRFSPAYQPVHIRELCDLLIDLKCVFRYCVTTKSKPSLFSKPCEVLVKQSTGLECENDIRYEADKYAIINLGKFLETRPYTKDFIECLLGK